MHINTNTITALPVRLMQTQPDEIANMCFQRSKKCHLDSDVPDQGDLKTDSNSINVEPTESDKEFFLIVF